MIHSFGQVDDPFDGALLTSGEGHEALQKLAEEVLMIALLRWEHTGSEAEKDSVRDAYNRLAPRMA